MRARRSSKRFVFDWQFPHLLPGGLQRSRIKKSLERLLMSSHGVIPHIRWSFASEYSLLCATPVPRDSHSNQTIAMTEHLSDPVLEIQSADPLTRRLRCGLPCKPCTATLPLLSDPVHVALCKNFPATEILPFTHGRL